MARVREIQDVDPLLPEVREAFDQDVKAYGAVLNSSRVYGHTPGILRAVKALGKAIADSGHIEPQLRMLVNVRVAQVNGCPF